MEEKYPKLLVFTVTWTFSLAACLCFTQSPQHGAEQRHAGVSPGEGFVVVSSHLWFLVLDFRRSPEPRKTCSSTYLFCVSSSPHSGVSQGKTKRHIFSFLLFLVAIAAFWSLEDTFCLKSKDVFAQYSGHSVYFPRMYCTYELESWSQLGNLWTS